MKGPSGKTMKSAGTVLEFEAHKPKHYLATITYRDGECFGRVYTDMGKAQRFAERQKRLPIVKSVRVSPLPGNLQVKDLTAENPKRQAPEVLPFNRASSGR
jgi:hypothetical protein